MLQEQLLYYRIELAILGGVLLFFLALSHLTARSRYEKKMRLSRSHVSLANPNAIIRKVTKNVYLAYTDRCMVVFLSPASGTLLIANPLALDEQQLRFFEDLTTVSIYEDAVSVIISTSSHDDTRFYTLRYPNAKVFRSVAAYEAYTLRHAEFSQVILQRPYHRNDSCGDALILINDISVSNPSPSKDKSKKHKSNDSHTNNVICCLPKSFKGSNKISCNRFMRKAFSQTLLSMTTTSHSQSPSTANKALGKNVFLGLSPNLLITYQGEVFVGREMCDAILLAGAEVLDRGSTMNLREH